MVEVDYALCSGQKEVGTYILLTFRQRWQTINSIWAALCEILGVLGRLLLLGETERFEIYWRQLSMALQTTFALIQYSALT